VTTPTVPTSPVHRSARIDRAATKATGPLRFIAATEGRQADGIDLRVAGARLERFRANPVVGYGHAYHGRENLPIGRGVGVEVVGRQLLIDVEFDQGDPFAVEVERKYRAGIMHAVSIGFDVNEWEGGKGSYMTGGVATKWTLHELSVVPIPMDANAVVLAGRAAGVDPRDARALLDVLDDHSRALDERALNARIRSTAASVLLDAFRGR
jgi:hypothetical protein